MGKPSSGYNAADDGTYDTLQSCENGHVATPSYHDFPNHRQAFCNKCGAKTIIACPHCSAELNGSLRGVLSVETPTPPRFCIQCGGGMPWTNARVAAAKAFVDELSELPDNESLLLKSSIDDLVRDTPQTQVAIVRFKKYGAKAGKGFASAARDVLVDVVSETVRKAIWGPNA